MPVRPHYIYSDIDDLDANPIAWVHPASMDDVNFMLEQAVGPGDGPHDGVSPWLWVRLADGTLVLGFFPQGTAYEEVEDRCLFGVDDTVHSPDRRPPVPIPTYRMPTGTATFLAVEDEQGCDLTW